MDNKNEITETDLVEVAMPEVTSEDNPESKTEAAGKKPERKKEKISKGAIAVIVVAALVIGGLTVKTFVDSFKEILILRQMTIYLRWIGKMSSRNLQRPERLLESERMLIFRR